MPLRKLHEDYEDADLFGLGLDSTDDADTGPVDDETPQERYGGLSLASVFFGWLVSIAITVLMAGIFGAGATAAGGALNLTQSQAEEQAGTIGVAGGIALLVILATAYYAGGYVGGRMSRFDGGRQGFGVWLLGLLVTILVAVLGARFGSEYDAFQQASLPSVSIPTDTLAVAGVGTVVLATLVSAILGGKAGQRYHAEIDGDVT